MLVLYIAIGLVAGFLIGYLYVNLRSQKIVEQQLQNHPITAELRSNLAKITTDLNNERNAKMELATALATSKAQLVALEEKLLSQLSEVKELKTQFQTEFQNLANRIFDEKSEKFQKQNRDQLDIVLSPFRQKLTDFENKVEKVYKEENNERINLKAELKLLSEMNKQLSTDANNLATALKGSNKSQGNWGEMILEKILERSGLQAGQEYEVQTSDQNQDGRIIRPDVVVHLPEGKHIIIDSKVSLIAYNSMIAAGSDEERERYLKAHLESIRSHIKQLSEKNYATAKKLVTPDFVLLFMPIEAAFSAAMQLDSELYNYAWDKKVVLVSPTTLLATLRTVASIWVQEKRTRNAEEIALEAGKLYDKFSAFVDDLIDVGKRMDSAKGSYEEAMKKLTSGTGNLVGRAEKMRKLGARNQKDINPLLVERSSQNEESGI
ncbi:MAG: DNA recombination protein RmuC [Flavobacteriales bacterium]